MKPEPEYPVEARGKARLISDFVSEAFARYGSGLERFLIGRLRNRHLRSDAVQAIAQDLAQETYLRLLRVEDTQLIRHPQAYLYRIAANLVYEYRLREVRVPVTYDSELMNQHAQAPAETPANEPSQLLDASDRLEGLLEELSPAYRAIVVLRKRDGLSYDEIGKVLKLSPNTVKKYLVRALAQLREARWDASG